MYEFGTKKFTSQKSASDFVSSFLEKYEDGSGIPEEDFNDWVLPFVKNHPVWDTIKNEFEDIIIRSDDSGKYNNFTIVTTKGEQHRLSKHRCISGKEKGFQEKLREACRESVRTQTSCFFNNNKPSPTDICVECNRKLCNGFKLHVDHIYPFENLVCDWYKEQRPQFKKSVFFIEVGDRLDFKDSDIRDSWTNFHQKEARLQLLHSICNIKKGKRVN